ncbi:hypothetical protein [Butyrivibrio sp. MC2021]|uniref:hypothetical protein n=1 Tax=Butyrivibrio sp. MC2021 TaxID=1408306 RepID=UPI00047BA1D8|nr:hypothetical protein [Butyrivibrio sp. MC2021]
MKRKNLVSLVVAATMALALAGCGKTDSSSDAVETAEVQQETAVQEEQTTQIANPWRDSTEEEANQVVPALFKLPEGVTNAKWSLMEDTDPSSLPGELVQAVFNLDDLEYTARAQVTGDDNTDVSGLYYDWTVTDDITFSTWRDGLMTGTYSRFISDEYTIDLIRWFDVELGVSYSLSTEAKDLEGFDLQAIAEMMYDAAKYGSDIPDETAGAPEAAAEAEHVPMDITGCETFTQIVDKLQAGQGYANANINGEDVLLVTDYTFDNIDQIAAIDAEIYRYADGVPTYMGYVTAGGTAYPFAIADGKLYACGNHFAKKLTVLNGSLMLDQEAYVNYDTNGDATYFVISEIGNSPATADGQVEDDSYMSAIYDEYNNGEIIEFNAVQ